MNSGDCKYEVKTGIRCWDFVDMTENWWTEYRQDAPCCDRASEKARNIQRKMIDRKKERKKESAYIYIYIYIYIYMCVCVCVCVCVCLDVQLEPDKYAAISVREGIKERCNSR